MKLGFAEAVTKCTNCGVPDLYRIWLFGSTSYKHTPRYSAYENMVETPDERDFIIMLGEEKTHATIERTTS